MTVSPTASGAAQGPGTRGAQSRPRTAAAEELKRTVLGLGPYQKLVADPTQPVRDQFLRHHCLGRRSGLMAEGRRQLHDSSASPLDPPLF